MLVFNKHCRPNAREPELTQSESQWTQHKPQWTQREPVEYEHMYSGQLWHLHCVGHVDFMFLSPVTLLQVANVTIVSGGIWAYVSNSMLNYNS